jgi:glycerol-3-phosphate dehydrogenase (NAD(P)+)
MTEIAILGAGSFGTAMAVLYAGAGNDVRLWARRPDFVDELARRRENQLYLQGVPFPDNLRVTSRLDELVGCEIVVLAAPSHGYREVLRAFLPLTRESGKPLVVVSSTKGIETATLARMSEVTFEEAVAANREVRFATLSGPTFALELAQGVPSTAVLASDDAHLAPWLQERLSTRSLRLYTSHDLVGVEVAGTAKNVIAIAAGTLVGLGLGHNTLAALLTRGLHEITRLGIACGGQARTFSGLAGLGDLVLTCTGGLSRNRRIGLELASGRTLADITGGTSQVAEGVRNSLAVARIAQQKGVSMPITEQMVEVLHHGKSPRLAVGELMSRGLKAESEL